MAAWCLLPGNIVCQSGQNHIKLFDPLGFCRRPDTSLQSIFGSLRDGSRPWGAFGLLVNAELGVSSLRWPCLRLPLRSPRLGGMQGERKSPDRNIMGVQWRWSMGWANFLRNVLTGLLLTPWPGILVTFFPLFVCMLVNIHQLRPLQVTA